MYIKYVVKLIETESRGACKMTVVWEDAELASPTKCNTHLHIKQLPLRDN